jgi:hypothetical protein
VRTEIRCCCDAKLLGTIPKADFSRKVVIFALPDGERLELKWGVLADKGHRWPALNSNHTPIEKLRLIPGFEEAK